MKIQEGTQFCFTANECRLSNTGQDGMPAHHIKYSEDDAFRKLTWEFVYRMVDEHRNTFSQNYCGRCGNSCRRSDVLVREQEVLRIQQHLGTDETTFRNRYLQPGVSWNAGDGFMKLENGACPFLQTTGDGPQTATCTIHDIRPQSCRDYPANQASCRKDVGVLIESLFMITVDRQSTRIFMHNGDVGEVPTRVKDWNALVKAAKAAEPPDPERLERIADTVLEIYGDLIKGYHKSKVDDLYMSNFHRLRGLVEGVASLSHLNPDVSQKVEQLWSQFRRLEALLAGKGEETEEVVAPAPKLAEDDVEWAFVQETGMTMKFRDREQAVTLSFSAGMGLIDSARGFLHSILARDDDTLQTWLREDDPPCYMCGECCRFYSVEIKPSDVLRLCELLKMTPAKFVEEYTIPARFGWNKKNRILKKVPAPRYGKNLKELRLLGQGPEMDTKQCSFLERREDGFFYCSVHSHKPQVCRDYTARNTLCRNTNQVENWGRQAKTVAWIHVTPAEISVQTHARVKAEQPALNFPRSHWPEVDSSFLALGKALQDHLVGA